MNAAELGVLYRHGRWNGAGGIINAARNLAQRNGRAVFVTCRAGMVGAMPDGRAEHVASHPVRGEIDVVAQGMPLPQI